MTRTSITAYLEIAVGVAWALGAALGESPSEWVVHYSVCNSTTLLLGVDKIKSIDEALSEKSR